MNEAIAYEGKETEPDEHYIHLQDHIEIVNKLLSQVSMAEKQIIEAMRDTLKASDTVWIRETETLFDRLGIIYAQMGGDEERLKEAFPDAL